MIFESLYESSKHNELLLVEHGFCRFHLRRNGQVTIYEIIVTNPCHGIGTALLDRLRAMPGATSILARCPVDLAANGWYQRRGFELLLTEQARSGRMLNVWMLML